MPNAISFVSYKLVEGASAPDFLLVSEQCHNEVVSKWKGFVSWRQLRDGDTWVDLVEWKTMEDAVNADKNDCESNPLSQKFTSFINFDSLKMQTFSVEKNY